MAWCLTKQTEQKLLEALKKEGDPQKMVDRGTEGRRKWFAQFGEENAKNLNTFYESRMLLKDQQKGLIGFAKGLGGSKQIKTDFLSKVERLKTALSKSEVDQYLGDYADKRLGTEALTEEQFKTISDMSTKLSDYKSKFNPETLNNLDTTVVDGKFKQKWQTENPTKEYGALQRAFENYVNDLKFPHESGIQIVKGRLGQFKAEAGKNPALATAKLILDAAKTIADNSVSVVASVDDSLFGRQGIMTLLTGHPILWGRNFIKSFGDIARSVGGGKNTTDALMSDIYSNPLFMNGEFKTAGIVDLMEEQFPTMAPARIPGFGRIFKGSEETFVNGSIRMRTELYTMMRNAKVETGIQMTKEEIISTGKVVNSILARGTLGTAGQNPIVRLLMWAPKMLKADLDILTAHVFDKDVRFLGKDSKTAIGNLIKITAITSITTSLLNLNNPKSVELDPRSSDFLKPLGKFGYLRGMPQIITLLSRLATGEYKNAKGEIVKYEPGIGKRSRLDALISFIRGKAPPATGGVYDWLAGQDYQGNPPTFTSTLLQHAVPISIQNLIKLRKDPTVDNTFGVIADFFGLNANITPEPNIKSKIIPEGKAQKSQDVVEFIKTYSEAISSDPETAFNRMFTGQKIVKTENGTIIVERMSLYDSQAIKKKYGQNTKEVKLDHTIPLELGGSNDTNNLKLVSTSEWSSYTKVENALGAALKAKKVSKSEAQSLITQFKAISDNATRKKFGLDIIAKYK